MPENSNTADLDDAGDEPATDLLGDPMRDYRDSRGRRKLRVTNELRDRVAVLRAGGMERDEIADAVGCSERTLRTYFLPELNEGKSEKRAAVIEALYAAAIGGSVSAAKAFLALSQRADAIPRVAAESKPGKKEQQAMDAQTGHRGSRWAALLN